MPEALSYWFFQNALIAGIIISIITGSLGSFVVLRREPNIAHAIANTLFLGIVVSFFFSANLYVIGIMFAILGVGVMLLLENFTPTSRESSKEIMAQIGLAGGIFWVGFLWNMQLDVFNFLFGSILFVDSRDIYLLVCIAFTGLVLLYFFGKKFTRIILSPEIAKSQGIRIHIYEMGYLLYLSLFIALSLKVFWVLLLWAFLVLPGNIWKTLSKSFRWVFIYATISACIASIAWLFVSYYFDTSAGASIVLVLGFLLILSFLFSRK